MLGYPLDLFGDNGKFVQTSDVGENGPGYHRYGPWRKKNLICQSNWKTFLQKFINIVLVHWLYHCWFYKEKTSVVTLPIIIATNTSYSCCKYIIVLVLCNQTVQENDKFVIAIVIEWNVFLRRSSIWLLHPFDIELRL